MRRGRAGCPGASWEIDSVQQIVRWSLCYLGRLDEHDLGEDAVTVGDVHRAAGQDGLGAEKAAGSRLLPDQTFAFGADCAVVKPESGAECIVFTISNGTFLLCAMF